MSTAAGAVFPRDYLIRVGYNQITPEDIELLRETLGLSEVAADAAYNLAGKFGQERWLGQFLELGGQDLRELANDINVNERALSTLHNRLGRLKRFHFITERESEESVEEILRNLDRGIHVVVEFGRYRHELSAYMLVANLVTRRIHERYVRRKEEAMGDASRGASPAGDNNRGGAQVPQSKHRFADHIRQHRPGDAQVQRDAAGG